MTKTHPMRCQTMLPRTSLTGDEYETSRHRQRSFPEYTPCNAKNDWKYKCLNPYV